MSSFGLQKVLTVADLDKHLRWCRSTAPDIFWTPFHRKDGQQSMEAWKCFEAVYQAATSTAIKFMNMIDRAMKPSTVVKCGAQSFEAFQFLCKNLSGLIIVSYRRSGRFSVIDETFEQYYTCGFRAWMRVNELTATPPDVSKENCEACSESPCICSKIATLFKEANLYVYLFN